MNAGNWVMFILLTMGFAAGFGCAGDPGTDADGSTSTDADGSTGTDTGGSTCTDTDGGNNIHENGTTCELSTTTGGWFCQTDECVSSTSLKEYYCNEDTMVSKITPCAYGCVDGMCIKAINARTNIGVFRNGHWLIDYDLEGTADNRLTYGGRPDDLPFVGDFDNNGFSGNIGVFRNGFWFIDYDLDENTDDNFWYGEAGDLPIVGDFDKDGFDDDIGLFKDGNWYLDYNLDGITDHSLTHGRSGDLPIVGDFDKDGFNDNIGVFRDGTWYLDYNLDGITDRSFVYGRLGDLPIVGDFDKDGFNDDIGVFRDGNWDLDYDLDGTTDHSIVYGESGDIPFTGYFDVVICNSDNTDHTGKCNASCGASQECDGIAPNSCFSNSLEKCSSNCREVSSCGDGTCNCGEDENNCLIDCSNHLPIGYLDRVTQTQITGWGYDQDAGTNPIRVHVYIDGDFAGSTTANQPRPDLVDAGATPNPNHGFTWDIPSGIIGKHMVNVYAINNPQGTNPELNNSPMILISEETSNINKISETVLPEAFAHGMNGGGPYRQESIMSHNGRQYAAFYSVDRYVSVARRELPSGNWETLELMDYHQTIDDGHNTISLGICPSNGTIHLAFDHHCDSLHYRKSISGLATNPDSYSWTASNFGPVQDCLSGNTSVALVTYPRFITVPNGKLQFVYRFGPSCGDGESIMYEYNDGNWTLLGKFIDNPNHGNPYFHGITYDTNNRLHVVFNWRDTTLPKSNHDLYYIYSDDYGRTWKNNSGVNIGTTGSEFVSENSSGAKVWSIDNNRGYINQESMTIDQQGRVHVLVSHIKDSEPDNTDFNNARSNSYPFHYWRDTDGEWHKTQMPFKHKGPRGKIIVDSSNDAYALLGSLRIASASIATNWTDWQIVDSVDEHRFHGSELGYDRHRLASDNILSIYYLDRNEEKVYILDYDFF